MSLIRQHTDHSIEVDNVGMLPVRCELTRRFGLVSSNVLQRV